MHWIPFAAPRLTRLQCRLTGQSCRRRSSRAGAGSASAGPSPSRSRSHIHNRHQRRSRSRRRRSANAGRGKSSWRAPVPPAPRSTATPRSRGELVPGGRRRLPLPRWSRIPLPALMRPHADDAEGQEPPSDGPKKRGRKGGGTGSLSLPTLASTTSVPLSHHIAPADRREK